LRRTATGMMPVSDEKECADIRASFGLLCVSQDNGTSRTPSPLSGGAV
jgi:hypothetical protein